MPLPFCLLDFIAHYPDQADQDWSGNGFLCSMNNLPDGGGCRAKVVVCPNFAAYLASIVRRRLTACLGEETI